MKLFSVFELLIELLIVTTLKIFPSQNINQQNVQNKIIIQENTLPPKAMIFEKMLNVSVAEWVPLFNNYQFEIIVSKVMATHYSLLTDEILNQKITLDAYSTMNEIRVAMKTSTLLSPLELDQLLKTFLMLNTVIKSAKKKFNQFSHHKEELRLIINLVSQYYRKPNISVESMAYIVEKCFNKIRQITQNNEQEASIILQNKNLITQRFNKHLAKLKDHVPEKFNFQ